MVEFRKLVQEQYPAVTEGDLPGPDRPATAYQASLRFNVESIRDCLILTMRSDAEAREEYRERVG